MKPVWTKSQNDIPPFLIVLFSLFPEDLSLLDFNSRKRFDIKARLHIHIFTEFRQAHQRSATASLRNGIKVKRSFENRLREKIAFGCLRFVTEEDDDDQNSQEWI